MKRIRKEDLSLFHYIKDTVLRDFIEIEQQVPLDLMRELSCSDGYVYQALTDMVPIPTSRGRGWTYFDCPVVDSDGYCIYSSEDSCRPEFVTVTGTDGSNIPCTGTPEQSERVTVYNDSLVEIPSSEYVIDYIDGRIVTSSSSINPKYVDYFWNYVSVVDEWSLVDSIDTPIIVIDMNKTDKAGYQLGAGKKVKRRVDLHIFAQNTAERNDLTETLFDGLYNKSAPVYDLSNGDILDFDGTFYGRKVNPNKLTSLFNRTSLNDLNELHGGMQFENVSARNIDLSLILSGDSNASTVSDLNAYRSKISFDVITYTRS